jgi:choline transport protein
MAPIACGQYYWVYMLAPPNYKKVSSYVVGWLTSLAWIATVATESLFAGTMIQGILIMNYPNYVAQRWQGTLLTWLVIAVNVFINTVIPGALPKYQLSIMLLHILGFFAVMITLLKTSPIGDNATVWLTSLNEGGWSTQGLSYCIGFIGNVATFVGADASVHMAEEVENAAINIPRAITIGMLVNGLIGFAMMITTLYCLGDIDTVVGTKTAFPFLQIFLDSLQNNLSGAIVLAVIVLILTWSCALGITTTASRMTWSFARDQGTPFSRFISKVNKRTRVPNIAVGVVTVFAALLVCIYAGSYAGFNDVISLTVTGFYGSYLLPCALLLYHRVKGNIMPYHGHADVEESVGSSSGNIDEKQPAEPIPEPMHAWFETRLTWGPWQIKGILGSINNAYACCYMVFVIFWSVWPAETPVTAEGMNYSIAVTGGVMILSAIWYFVRGRKEYKGPILDDDAQVVARRAGSIVAI